MLKKICFAVVGVSLGMFMISHQSYGQGAGSTTTQNTTQTVTTPVKKGAAKVETTETTVTSTPARARPAYSQEALKKMDHTLCTDGFDAKIGNDNKNICSGMATAPDLSYSCIWTKKGEAAYPVTLQGPCNLDFAEHRGNIVITKADYKSSPPLPYGTKIECCYRAAKGPATISTSSWTSSGPKTK